MSTFEQYTNLYNPFLNPQALQPINPLPSPVLSPILRQPFVPGPRQVYGPLAQRAGPIGMMILQLLTPYLRNFFLATGIIISRRQVPLAELLRPSIGAISTYAQQVVGQQQEAVQIHEALSRIGRSLGLPDTFARYAMQLRETPIIGGLVDYVMRFLMPEGLPSEMLPGITAAANLRISPLRRFVGRPEIVAREQTRYIQAVSGALGQGATLAQNLKRLGMSYGELGQMILTMERQGLMPRNIDRISSAIKDMAETIGVLKDIFGPNAPIAQLMNQLNQMTQGQWRILQPAQLRQLVSTLQTQSILTGIPGPAMAMLYTQGVRMGMQRGLTPLAALSAQQMAVDYALVMNEATRGIETVFPQPTLEDRINKMTTTMQQITSSRAGRATSFLIALGQKGLLTPELKQLYQQVIKEQRYITPTELFRVAPRQMRFLYYSEQGQRLMDIGMQTQQFKNIMQLAHLRYDVQDQRDKMRDFFKVTREGKEVIDTNRFLQNAITQAKKDIEYTDTESLQRRREAVVKYYVSNVLQKFGIKKDDLARMKKDDLIKFIRGVDAKQLPTDIKSQLLAIMRLGPEIVSPVTVLGEEEFVKYSRQMQRLKTINEAFRGLELPAREIFEALEAPQKAHFDTSIKYFRDLNAIYKRLRDKIDAGKSFEEEKKAFEKQLRTFRAEEFGFTTIRGERPKEERVLAEFIARMQKAKDEQDVKRLEAQALFIRQVYESPAAKKLVADIEKLGQDIRQEPEKTQELLNKLQEEAELFKKLKITREQFETLLETELGLKDRRRRKTVRISRIRELAEKYFPEKEAEIITKQVEQLIEERKKERKPITVEALAPQIIRLFERERATMLGLPEERRPLEGLFNSIEAFIQKMLSKLKITAKGPLGTEFTIKAALNP